LKADSPELSRNDSDPRHCLLVHLFGYRSSVECSIRLLVEPSVLAVALDQFLVDRDGDAVRRTTRCLLSKAIGECAELRHHRGRFQLRSFSQGKLDCLPHEHELEI